jgi:hypothetical protein
MAEPDPDDNVIDFSEALRRRAQRAAVNDVFYDRNRYVEEIDRLRARQAAHAPEGDPIKQLPSLSDELRGLGIPNA